MDEPDRLNVAMSAGPRVLLSMEGLERSQLEQFGSRITRRIQFKSTPAELSELENSLNSLQEQHPELRIQGASAGIPSASRGIGNVERFLSLVALLSMMVGVIGIVQSIQAWLRERRSTMLSIAVWEYLRGAYFVWRRGWSFCPGRGVVGVALAYSGLWGLFSLIAPYLPIEIVISPTSPFRGWGLVCLQELQAGSLRKIFHFATGCTAL